MRPFWHLVAFSLFISTFSTPIMAADKTSELNAVKAQINALQDVLKKQKKDESQSEKTLRKIEESLASIRRNLQQQDKKIRQQTKQLSSLQLESASLQKRLSKQQAHLKQQIQSAYFIGQQGQLQLILNQHDSATVGRMLTYYQYLNDARAKRIHTVQDDLKQLASVRKRISNEKSSLQKLRQKKSQDLAALSSQFKEREQFLSSLRASMQNQEVELSSLEKDKRRITTLINSLETVIDDIPAKPPESITFSKRKGRLPWPSKGNVKHSFGSLRAGQDLRWQGVFIRSKAGRQVSAVADGRVVFADWLAGFGLIVIIDHQDNYMSLYAHNSVLFKEVGDWVNANQAIAEIGKTGGIEQAGLYFEIRKKGVPVNPKIWLAKR